MTRNQQRIVSTIVMVWPCLFATTLHAQPASVPSATVMTVPRLVLVTGTFAPATGLPAAPVETVTLAVYAEETGGTPLWQEMQNVVVDKAGRFSLLVGATQPDGIPREVFASGEAQWLGLRVRRGRGTAAHADHERAVCAAIGGRGDARRAPGVGLRAGPPVGRPGDSSTTSAIRGHEGAPSAADAVLAGTPNFLAKYVTSADVGNSAVYEAGGFVGIGTTTPFDSLHVRFLNTNGAFTGYAVQNLGSTATSYSGMLFYDQFGALGQFQGFNNVTHEYRINNIASGGSINFMTGSVSRFKVRADGDVDLSGSLRKGGVPFLSSVGTANTFLGANAGNVTMTGNFNTATGAWTLASNTTGSSNTASGYTALEFNTTGDANTASGYAALVSNTTGGNNTATGVSALDSNTTGVYNTASGVWALRDNTTGGNNVAVGYVAGLNATTGSNNIYLGANVLGSAGESNTMYLGVQGTQTKTVVAGIRGITTGLADAVPVLIDSAGQLGTVSSSRRFKEDIRDMGETSRAIFALRPVTFRYATAYTDGAKPLQYGLVAEEVADVFPALAVFNADGGVDTVHYETLSVLLLNEVQQQRIEIDLLKARLAALEAERP